MIVSYFTHSRLALADGTSFHQHGLFCASNRYPLGTELRVTSKRTGRSVIVTVRDRSARWVHHPDLCSRAAARIEPRYRIVGHIPVTIRVVRQAHQTKHNAHQTKYCHAFRRMRRHG